MSLIDLLRAAAGEVSGSSAIGRWRQRVSQSLDESLEASFIEFPTVRPGVGNGAPTQAAVGPTLGYLMSVDDFVYAESFLNSQVDRTKSIIVGVSWAPTGSEADVVVSWQIGVGTMKPGKLLSVFDVTKTMADQAVNPTAFIYQRTGFVLTSAEWNADPDTDELHIRVTRVASSNDPSDDPAIHHIAVIQTLLK